MVRTSEENHRGSVECTLVPFRLGSQKSSERAEDYVGTDAMWGVFGFFGEVDQTAAGSLKGSPWDEACAGQ